MKNFKGSHFIIAVFILISNATLSQLLTCTQYLADFNYKSPYCIKNFRMTLHNTSEFKVKSVTGRLVISNQASGYRYMDQKIKLYVSINPYSVKAGNTVRLNDYCFLQRANSFDGISVSFYDIEVEWSKTAAQLANEKRMLKERAEYNRQVAREVEAQRKEDQKIKLIDDGLLSKAQLFLENGEYVNALALVKQTSDYTNYEYSEESGESGESGESDDPYYYYAAAELVNDCISKLKDQYVGEFENLIEEEIKTIINNNQTLLASLPKKKYSFIIDYEGNIICTDSSTLKLRNSEPAIGKNLLIEEYYKIPIKSKFDLDISLAKEGKLINPDNIIFHMNPNYATKTIEKNGEKYFLSGFGSPIFAAMVPNASYVTDSAVIDLQIPIYKTIGYDIICNGNAIGSEIKTLKTEEITVLKGTGRKVIKIITAPIWISLAIGVLLVL